MCILMQVCPRDNVGPVREMCRRKRRMRRRKRRRMRRRKGGREGRKRDSAKRRVLPVLLR